jgi:hypothetical protein
MVFGRDDDIRLEYLIGSAFQIKAFEGGAGFPLLRFLDFDSYDFDGAITENGTNLINEISSKVTVTQLTAATRAPYIIPWSTNIAPALTDGIDQAVTQAVTSAATITWPACSADVEGMLKLTIPPVGTNVVSLSSANGAYFQYVIPLASTNALSTTNATCNNPAGPTSRWCFLRSGPSWPKTPSPNNLPSSSFKTNTNKVR